MRRIRESPQAQTPQLSSRLDPPLWTLLVNTKCPVCKAQYFHSETRDACVQAHGQTVGPPIPLFPCLACTGLIFYSSQDLRIHRIAKHNKKKLLRCKCCPYSTTSEFNINRHSESHYRKDLYRCSMCPRQYKTLRTCKNHCVSDHMPTIRCDICSRGFATYRQLLEHQRVHDNLLAICTICQFQASDKMALKVHYDLEHPLQPYEQRGDAEPMNIEELQRVSPVNEIETPRGTIENPTEIRNWEDAISTNPIPFPPPNIRYPPCSAWSRSAEPWAQGAWMQPSFPGNESWLETPHQLGISETPHLETCPTLPFDLDLAEQPFTQPSPMYDPRQYTDLSPLMPTVEPIPFNPSSFNQPLFNLPCEGQARQDTRMAMANSLAPETWCQVEENSFLGQLLQNPDPLPPYPPLFPPPWEEVESTSNTVFIETPRGTTGYIPDEQTGKIVRSIDLSRLQPTISKKQTDPFTFQLVKELQNPQNELNKFLSQE
jgi:hypothetical protein